jgi:hypothetical protein
MMSIALSGEKRAGPAFHEAGVKFGKPVSGQPLERFEVRRHLTTIAAIFKIEADFLIVGQTCQARSFNCGYMDKNILAAAFGFDEPVTFSGIEPFYGAIGHTASPFFVTSPDMPGHAISAAAQLKTEKRIKLAKRQ